MKDYKILIVDDELEVRNLLTSALKREGYTVACFETTEDALKILAEEHFEITLVDNKLPGMSGLDLLKIINSKYPESIRILMSGYLDVSVLQKAINESEIFRILEKPIRLLDLYTTIKNAAGQYDLKRQNRELMRSLEEKIEERTKKLIESEEKFNIFTNFSYDWVTYKDRNGEIVYVSPAFTDITGYEVKEFISGKIGYNDLLEKDDLEKLNELLLKLPAKESFQEKEFKIKRKDNEKRYVSVSAQPALINSEEYIGSFVSIRDVTNQKVAEELLWESESRMHAITNSAQDAILMMDPEGRVSYWNLAAERIFGYASAEAIGKNLHALLVPQRYHVAHHVALPEFQRTGKGGAIGKTIGLEAYRKDGEEISVELSLSAAHFTDGWHAIGILRDITERKKTEEKLRELSRAVEQSPASIVITDIKGNIEYVNPKFLNITGYALEEAMGQNPRILKSGELSAENYSNLWETITSGREWRGEFHNKKKDGTLYWESASISPVKDCDNKIISFIAIKEDITERKKMEDELSKLNEYLTKQYTIANDLAKQAERANKAKSEFLANMSHEIRTPMNGIIGMTDLLLGTGLTKEQHEFAEIVKMSADSLLTLVNDILDFSKIESGKVELEKIDFDLRTTIKTIFGIIGIRAIEKKLELANLIHSNVPSLLRGDPGRLRQILLNLMGNALKFTSSGGITVEADVEKEDDIHVTIRFKIRDTGIGIPKDRLNCRGSKVFPSVGS